MGERGRDHVILVLGHPDSNSRHLRLQLAASIAREDPPRALVLSGGYGGTNKASEAALMTEEASEIKELKFPMLLDEASVDTAGNAARSLAIICAIGGITRVTVVTSNYHLRAPWYFRPYRSYGLTVRFRFCHDRGLFMSEVKRQIFSTLRIMKKRQEVYSSPYLQTLRTTNRSTTRKPRR